MSYEVKLGSVLGKPSRVIIPVQLPPQCNHAYGEPTYRPSNVGHCRVLFTSFHVIHNLFLLPLPFLPLSQVHSHAYLHMCKHTQFTDKVSVHSLHSFSLCQWELVSGVSTVTANPRTAYKFSKSATIRSVAEILADMISGGQPRKLGICCESARLFPLSTSDSTNTSDRVSLSSRACDVPAGINRTAWALSLRPRVMTSEQNWIKALAFFLPMG